MRRSLASRILRFERSIRNLQRLVAAELSSTMPAPLGRRLWAWRHGFLTCSAVRYELTPDNLHLFVSDWVRYTRTPWINGEFAHALNNKVVFSRMLAGYGCRVPEYYCVMRGGRMIQVGDRYRMRSPSDVVDACLSGGRFILKPYTGGGGLRVTALSSENGKPTVNWKESTPEAVEELVGRLEDGVISEFVTQHKYASDVFPFSTNTMRILTMWDYERDEPFVAFAGHRFGRPSSVPVDNCYQGGVSCPVDIETGVLGVGRAGEFGDEVSKHETHPDTGAQMAGITVPHWERTKSELLDICRRMSYIPYIGWDVAITEDGFAVTEGNSCPDLGHQVYGPLLADPRVRKFYETFGVL